MPSRPAIEPNGRALGFGFDRKYASTWWKSVVSGGRTSSSGPSGPSIFSVVPASSTNSSLTRTLMWSPEVVISHYVGAISVSR